MEQKEQIRNINFKGLLMSEKVASVITNGLQKRWESLAKEFNESNGELVIVSPEDGSDISFELNRISDDLRVRMLGI
ncbi:hypothetical protein BH10BAC2_BH10BAC2_48920 [soil metagenome]